MKNPSARKSLRQFSEALDVKHKTVVRRLGAAKIRRSAKVMLCCSQNLSRLDSFYQIGNSIEEIIEEVGVRQGDNMSYVLFIFLIDTFAEILEEIWEDNGLKKVELQRVSDDDFEKGEGVVNSHTKAQYNSRKAVTFTVLQCLYVDDGSFTSESRDQLERGVQVLHDHFSRFGLEMHVGKSVDGKINAYKTECVFFPPPQFFNINIPSWQEDIEAEKEKHLSTERAR